jgi:hypothetical protein
MTPARPTLRIRLLASLLLVAVVVLSIAGGVTYLLVQGTAERAAVNDLRDKAPTVQTAVSQLALTARRATRRAGSGTATRLQLAQASSALRQIRGTLRLSEARLVFLDANGTPLSIADLGALGNLLSGTDPGTADLFALPEALDAGALQPDRIRNGETVTGRRGGVAFLAQPLNTVAGQAQLPVLVLTEPVQTDLPSRAIPAFLLAAAGALVACVVL